MKDRIISVDVLRGFTILMMTIVNNPGSWNAVYPILNHAKWNGCTLADFVFPFFILIVGIAIPLAMPIKKNNNENIIKIFTRSLRIISLGLFLNYFNSIHLLDLTGLPLLIIRLLITIIVGYTLIGNINQKTKTYLAFSLFIIFLYLVYSGHENFNKVRLPGVLQRIGIIYLIASLLYLKTSLKTQLFLTTFILLGYWALMTLIPVPNIGYPNLEIGTNLASWLDSILLKNHVYTPTQPWDPEGILSTLPAIANALIGILIGQLLIKPLPKIKITQLIGSISILLISIGLLWSTIFPINKSIWTSSFALYTAGIGLLLLTIIYYIVDVLQYKKWTKFILTWGVNPMIVFFLSGILPRIFTMIQLQHPKNPDTKINIHDYFYSFYISPYFENQMTASLTSAIIYSIMWSCLLWYFYKNKLIFKV